MHGTLVSLRSRRRDVPTQIGCSRSGVDRQAACPIHRRTEDQVIIFRRQCFAVRQLNRTFVGLVSRRCDVTTQVGCRRSRIDSQASRSVHGRSERHVTILRRQCFAVGQLHRTLVSLTPCCRDVPTQTGFRRS